MATLQLLLVIGVLSTDFHYLLEHRHDDPVCFAGAFGAEHYHEAGDDHTCFIGYHSPTWINQQPSNKLTAPADNVLCVQWQNQVQTQAPFHAFHDLRGPPACG